MSTGTKSFFGSAKNSCGSRLAGTPSIGCVRVEQPVIAVAKTPAATVLIATRSAETDQLRFEGFVIILELSSSEGSIVSLGFFVNSIGERLGQYIVSRLTVGSLEKNPKLGLIYYSNVNGISSSLATTASGTEGWSKNL